MTESSDVVALMLDEDAGLPLDGGWGEPGTAGRTAGGLLGCCAEGPGWEAGGGGWARSVKGIVPANAACALASEVMRRA